MAFWIESHGVTKVRVYCTVYLSHALLKGSCPGYNLSKSHFSGSDSICLSLVLLRTLSHYFPQKLIITSNQGSTAARAHQRRYYLPFKVCAAQQFRVQQQALPRIAFQHWATVGHVTRHRRSATKFTRFTRRDLHFHSQSPKSKNAVFHKLPSVTSPDKRFGSETLPAFILTFLLFCVAKVSFY